MVFVIAARAKTEVKGLYSENYKTLLKEIKDLNK